MEKAINWIVGVLLILSLIANIVLGILLANKKTDIIERKVYVTDTIVRDSIQIKNKVKTLYVTNFDTIVVVTKDTLQDSVYVEVPIEHWQYRDTIDNDSIKYDVKIRYSGFHATLDEIKLSSSYVKEETIIQKPKHWRQYVGIGIGGGYGMSLTTDKTMFTPYIGIGISYGFGYTW